MCMVIVIHHSGFLVPEGGTTLLPSGHVAADFFFILTGYFACTHLSKASINQDYMSYSVKYTFDKIKRVFPYALFGTISIYLLCFFDFSNGKSITDRIFDSQNLIYEIIFAPMLGVMRIDLANYKNAPLWFISVMLISLPAIMYLYLKCRDVFFNYFVFVIPGVLQCYLVRNYDGLTWTDYNGLFYSGLIRGFADLILGFAVYHVALLLKDKVEIKKLFAKILITAIEIVLLIYILYSAHRTITGYDQVFVIYLIAIMLVMTFTEWGYTSDLKGRVFEFAGFISMPVYCLHWAVYKGITQFMTIEYIYGVLLCVILSVLIAAIIRRLIYCFSTR